MIENRRLSQNFISDEIPCSTNDEFVASPDSDDEIQEVLLSDAQKKILANESTAELSKLLCSDDLIEIVPDFESAFDLLNEHQRLLRYAKDCERTIQELKEKIKRLESTNEILSKKVEERDEKIQEGQEEVSSIKKKLQNSEWEKDHIRLSESMTQAFAMKDKERFNARMEELNSQFYKLESEYTRAKLFFQEEVEKIKEEYNIKTWEHQGQFRFDQEIKLYKELADDYETKWKTEKSKTDQVKAELKQTSSYCENLQKMLNKQKSETERLKRKVNVIQKQKSELKTALRDGSFQSLESFQPSNPSNPSFCYPQTEPYILEQDGVTRKIVREGMNHNSPKKKRQKIPGVNGEPNEAGKWVWYAEIPSIDSQLIGKRIEGVTGSFGEAGNWIWKTGYNPKYKIGKKIPGITGEYNEQNEWIYYEKFNPETQSLFSQEVRNPPKAQSVLKDLIWNKGYKPRKFKPNSMIPRGQQK